MRTAHESATEILVENEDGRHMRALLYLILVGWCVARRITEHPHGGSRQSWALGVVQVIPRAAAGAVKTDN